MGTGARGGQRGEGSGEGGLWRCVVWRLMGSRQRQRREARGMRIKKLAAWRDRERCAEGWLGDPWVADYSTGGGGGGEAR